MRSPLTRLWCAVGLGLFSEDAAAAGADSVEDFDVDDPLNWLAAGVNFFPAVHNGSEATFAEPLPEHQYSNARRQHEREFGFPDTEGNVYFSSAHQDRILEPLLLALTQNNPVPGQGFFIESGARDGVESSNIIAM